MFFIDGKPTTIPFERVPIDPRTRLSPINAAGLHKEIEKWLGESKRTGKVEVESSVRVDRKAYDELLKSFGDEGYSYERKDESYGSIRRSTTKDGGSETVEVIEKTKRVIMSSNEVTFRCATESAVQTIPAGASPFVRNKKTTEFRRGRVKVVFSLVSDKFANDKPELEVEVLSDKPTLQDTEALVSTTLSLL
jgi:hypothetical protein